MNLVQAMHISKNYFWLEIFIDAGTVAVVVVLITRYLLRTGRLTPRMNLRRESMQLQAGVFAFGIEALLMLIFPLFTFTTHHQLIILLDGILFASLTLLVVHYYLATGSNENPQVPTVKAQKSALKVFLLVCYLFCLSLFLLFLINMTQQQKQIHITQLIDQEQQQLSLIKENLTHQVYDATLDTLILARQVNLQNVLINQPEALSELTTDYINLSEIKPSYEQIRFINHEGLERLRINQDYQGQLVVTEDKLQDKSNRYYFTDAFHLNPGEIYISPMDLNIEKGRIELPFKPIVRTATPVSDSLGNKQGIVIINLNASELLKQLKLSAKTSIGEMMLLNQDGYWISGREQDAAWAFMFPEFKNRTMEKYYPGVWKTISANKNGFLKTPDGYFVFETVETSQPLLALNSSGQKQQHPVWKLVTLVRPEIIAADLSDVSPPLGLFFIMVTLVTGIGALMYYRVQHNNIKAQQKIHHLAHHDPLTGLCNRRLFSQVLELELARTKRHKGSLALVYLDLDNFKSINDVYSHSAGDYVLEQFSERLKLILRESDTLARLGGDEFAAILPIPGTKEHLEVIAQRIIHTFKEPMIFNEQSLNVGISIGIAIHYNGQPMESLLHEADQAMYEAKKAGGNGYRFDR
ncbi:sensor domain-containing diguanylate cyclase [Amphritea japonica]|nr:sensor domain-containing diguanylate cyclase [Amphritea japonica]